MKKRILRITIIVITLLIAINNIVYGAVTDNIQLRTRS